LLVCAESYFDHRRLDDKDSGNDIISDDEVVSLAVTEGNDDAITKNSQRKSVDSDSSCNADEMVSKKRKRNCFRKGDEDANEQGSDVDDSDDEVVIINKKKTVTGIPRQHRKPAAVVSDSDLSSNDDSDDEMMSKKRKRNSIRNGDKDAKQQGSDSDVSDDEVVIINKIKTVTGIPRQHRKPAAVVSDSVLSSNDDSEDEMMSKKRKRNHVGKTDNGMTRKKNIGVRVKWSMQEKNILKAAFKRCKTCPVEGLVREVMAKHPILMKRTVAQVKSRAWHMIKTGR
jgi:hypothetical protein